MKLHIILILTLTTLLLLSAKAPQSGADKGVGIEDPHTGALKRNCAANLDRFCGSNDKKDKDYLPTLLCLEDNLDELDNNCQKAFFRYKMDLYTNPSLTNTLESMCGDELSKHCGDTTGQERIECLFKLRGSEKLKGRCPSYLNQLGQVLFSGYSALADTTQACASEIDSLGCTVGIGKTGVFGSPMLKLAQCILGNTQKLSPVCAKIFASEHDEAKKKEGLFEEKCRTDLRRLCATAQSKADKYECLVSHLKDLDRPACLKSLVSEKGYYFNSIQLGKEFYHYCSADIEKERCAESEIAQSSGEGEFVKLIDMFMCMEKGSILLSEECDEEVYNLREAFFGDYRISIELARACEAVREEFCPNNLIRMIDCIKDKVDGSTEFEECAAQVSQLSSSVDSPNLPQLDGRFSDLSDFCGTELTSFCSTKHLLEYEHKILCLKHQAFEHGVSSSCRDHMGRVQYFFSNHLDSNQFLACAAEYEGMCKTDEFGKIPCLMSHYADSERKEELSAQCRIEVEDYLYEAAVKTNIELSLFTACLPVLGEFCQTESNLECLKNHQEGIDHKSDCFEQLQAFNSVAGQMLSPNENVYKRCDGAIKGHCSKAGDVVDCLQKAKDLPNFDAECRNALMYVNKVTDTEWKFDSHLNKNCKGDITFHCPFSVGINEAIRCLTVKYKSRNLSKKCELYIRTILAKEATPRPLTGKELLKKNCQEELVSLCPSSTPDHYLSCLIDMKLDTRVRKSCQDQIIIAEIDFVVKKHMSDSFFRECASDMAKFCSTGSNAEVVLCLQSAYQVGTLSENCKLNLETDSAQLHKLQLDKDLAIGCHSAAFEECSGRSQSSEYIVKCLTKLMRALEEKGNKQCISEVVVLIGQAQLDIHKDQDLASKCEKEITTYCGEIPVGHGQKMRCLFGVKEAGVRTIGASCMKALKDREELWKNLSKEYPNIQRGLEAILDHIDLMKKRVFPNLGYILKMITFIVIAVVSCVALCCLSRLCRATRRVRRKIM